MQQQGQPSTQPYLNSQVPGGGVHLLDRNLYSGTLPAFGQQHNQLSDPALQVQPTTQEGDIFDDAAFERAFNAVHSQMQHLNNHMQERKVEAATGKIPPGASIDDMPRIGSDRILDEAVKGKQEHEGENDADELARTAGQLLENLKHDQSQKFQESNFLSLMRQLRDREVRVEGDKLVEVSVS